MKWNVIFTLTGPSGKIVEAPCVGNPIDCANLAALLALTARNLPEWPKKETIGIKIERVPCCPVCGDPSAKGSHGGCLTVTVPEKQT